MSFKKEYLKLREVVPANSNVKKLTKETSG
jgi:hypothetical protein